MRKKTSLIIGFIWPEPTATAAGNRMLQLLHYFLERDHRIVFASAATETSLSLDLSSLGIEKVCIKLNDTSFDNFIAGLKPEIVIFDRFLTEEQFGWRVAEFAPQALRILDTEDLHSLRNTRQILFKQGTSFTTAAWQQNDIFKREIASIYRCDLTLIISSYEMYLLTEILKIDKVLLLYLPFMLETINESVVQKWSTFEERKDFVCIGNGNHAPNIDAIQWLQKEIWPLIRKKLPKANLFIYGAYLPQHICQMDNFNNGFHIMGWAKSAEKVLQKARVALAPLRFGAGIKGKLIDAMQAGTPTVTTSIGAEGMHTAFSRDNIPTVTGGLEKLYPWSGHIANTAMEFADASVSLFQKGEWHQAQRNAIDILNGIYDKQVLRLQLDNTLMEIEDNLQAHRNQNFIGGMLMHHTLASTKYMSKWISAKNQKK